jgi:hypothetical protein
MHMLAATGELQQRLGGPAVSRAANAFKPHVVGDAIEDVGVLVLAQQHREIAVAAHVEGDEDVLMPEDVNPLPADAVDGIDVLVVEEGLIFEGAHPRAEAAGGEEAGAAHPEGRAVERFGGGVHPWSRFLLDAGCLMLESKAAPRLKNGGLRGSAG